MKIAPAIAVILLVFGATSGHAVVRNYFTPLNAGLRLDSCLTADNDCGKPAADYFCKMRGYEQAILFQREAASNTRRLVANDFCTGPDCAGFRQIKCHRSRTVLR